MLPLKNDRLLRALRLEPLDRPPLWLMRQAGRYLPEYLATRSKAGSFMRLCQTPEFACEVTLQPINRFEFDAAILFSDILTIPDAMGLGLGFVENEGPVFARPIQNIRDSEALPILDPEQELGYVMDAIRLIKKELHQRVPLIGFAGSPWTLASYMIEGKSTRDFLLSKKFLYTEPQAAQQLLHKLSVVVSDYLLAQIAAGVDAIMLFDSWGGVLTTNDYLDYSLASMRDVVKRVRAKAPTIPLILFTKGGALWLNAIKEVGVDAIGLDWTINLAAARKQLGDAICLQGNLDPAILFTNPTVVKAKTREILEANALNTGHIMNLGHGILPATPVENVMAMVETVKEFKYS